jgi:Tfp pilus assembly protein PilF
VISTNPEIAGRFYLANRQYSRAVPVFAGWLILDPDRPEPSLYLAKTLVLEGEFGRARVFAEKALGSVSRAAPKNRKRLQLDATLAKATAQWGSGDSPSAEALFTRPPLDTNSSACNNLGVLYLQEASRNPARYADAEKALQHALALDGQNFGAATSLGQTYSAEGKQQQAADAFKMALKIRPTSAEVADSYLQASHAANRDQDASEFCHAWVGDQFGGDAIVTDSTHDLYVLCAQAERGAKSASAPALALYYSEALARAEAGGEQGFLFSNLVDSMPDVLCPVPNPNHPVLETLDAEARRAAAVRSLTALLRKRAPADPRAAALVKNCERLIQRPK